MSRADELEPGTPRQLTGLDAMFANTNIVLLVLFGICCSGIGLILGIVGLVVCKDPVAKKNALTVTIIGGIVQVLLIIGICAGNAAKLTGH